ncbi:MAG: hypothetical protein ACKVRP_00875 [Bacteroidota bacterium]
MKLFKFAALVALAALPLLFSKKEKHQPAEVVESDHIFDSELSAD